MAAKPALQSTLDTSGVPQRFGVSSHCSGHTFTEGFLNIKLGCNRWTGVLLHHQPMQLALVHKGDYNGIPHHLDQLSLP